MRIGAIDLGTNSCRMLIVKYSQENFIVLKKDLKIIRLGEGVDRNKLLTEEAINRALIAILEYVEEMRAFNVKKITINGTSALREVSNAHLLVESLRERTGLQLNIISGAEEARLNYLGAEEEGKGSFILDIGGGSTEFIWQDKDGEINYRSLDIGAVRMTERYIKDPEKEISTEELMLIEEEVRAIINKEVENIPQNVGRAMGLGGTITTIAAIDQKLEEYDSARIQGYLLEKERIEEILKNLSQLNLADRKKIKGLEAGRADIIIAGIKILTTIMAILDIRLITVSEKDLLYGAIKELANKIGYF